MGDPCGGREMEMGRAFRFGYQRRATAWPEPIRAAAALPAGASSLSPGVLYRFVVGVDRRPAPMDASAIGALGDPFAVVLLRRGLFPLTVGEALVGLDAAGALPDQRSYLIGEAGQIPPEAGLERDFRLVVVRGQRPGQADLLISTGAVGDPAAAFLQIAAWDDAAGLFNYFMRVDRTWVWAGDSYSALRPGSRGQGCFDSHVNGSVVMKELKSPWMNWQSMKATILLARDDPLRTNPLYASLLGAEDLELIVRAAVARWTTARLERVAAGGRIEHTDRLLRQLCTTTTVNLASTDVESRSVAADPSTILTLPLGFWLNADALLDVLEIPADAVPPTVAGELYLKSLVTHGFRLVERDFVQEGDTFFAFVVPEAALEDNEVVGQMIARGILTARFAASVLMVDFPNPVFSPARAHLLRYVGRSMALDPAGGGLSDQIADAITEAAEATPAGSPERAFAANWALPEAEWADMFAARIQRYLEAVGRRIATPEGFDDYVRLAESRRREFAGMRLNEFSLTLPMTTIPADAPLLEMAEDGTVRPKS